MKKRIVGVSFLHGRNPQGIDPKTYHYFTDIEDLKPSDYAVVVVSELPAIVMVTNIEPVSDFEVSKASKWIAMKVNLEDYEKKVKLQTTIVAIERELDAQLKQVQRYEMFKLCAKTSPTMKALLQQLNELDPTTKLLGE